MDEETAKAEFDNFWNKFVFEKRDIGLSGYSYGLEMWIESARRADRKAREECAEICRDVHRNYECSRIGADLCKHAIRATIPESAE